MLSTRFDNALLMFGLKTTSTTNF